jgi:UDP-glucose:(heptosyl)LPS alpha-1,3-glucosyltransferase
MKIALAHKRLELRGGTERVLYHTAEGLRDRGHEVHLFCQQFRIPPPSGVFGHRVPGLSWPRTARLLTFGLLAPRVIARHDCDVVLSFDRIVKQDVFRSGEGPHKILLEKIKRRGGIWKELWYGMNPYHRLTLFIEKHQINSRGSSKIIAVCEQTKRQIIDTYGIPDEKVIVIHNGVDQERFHPSRRVKGSKRIRDGLGIPSDSALVLFVGTGFRGKGLDRLLHLWGRSELPRTYLVIVGNDARLSYYRKQWSREKDVIFVGAQTNVEDYYTAADLLVLPSIQEAFGNVVLEALASGLPVITVPGVGAMDRVEGDLKNGILTNPDDPHELKQKILRLLDPARWPLLSQQARQAAEKYTWRAYIDNVERSLYECCRQSVQLSLPAHANLARWSLSRSRISNDYCSSTGRSGLTCPSRSYPSMNSALTAVIGIVPFYYCLRDLAAENQGKPDGAPAALSIR